MKKIKILLSALLVMSCFIIPISADEQSNENQVVPEGFDSIEQYKAAPNYYDQERVDARNAKLANLDNVVENPNIRSGNVYKIGLRLIEQKTKWYCAAATAEMLIDYQLGIPNTWYQADMAREMQLDRYVGLANGEWLASLLRRATGLNYELQRISELPLMTALRADINAYCGLALLIEASPLYEGLRGKHVVAAKGYSDDEVYYNEPYKFDDLGIYGEQHKSISAMTQAINNAEGLYVW